MPRERGGLLLRLGFFVFLAGGLLLWSELRKPRDLALDVDLADALPGEVIESDVTVSRDRHVLVRFERRYGATGAPAALSFTVRARPGPAEVDVILVRASGQAERTRATVELRKDGSAVVRPRR